ncbi:Rrf2 family transcriptional regulator [Paenibacillus sp. MWE-103]|uniref:Rrf2 family transcriptional regulator n=1 Tax=Paenibacillus artemisiicola TaxID=1172618 RepID=A0ABS3WEJ7_9BACL|nr:Rrf2 family transcriptional regulator [Paenibacillus artemisiicola]MBO7746738.1 Rrf2 family transcriptional regulator [Paenibacillus artemisiicola]
MQYSIGVEYGLHCLVYLIDLPPDATVGIKELSEFQGISETYLSKIFGKLTKSGIVSSVPGVKGGYKLARSPVITMAMLEAEESMRNALRSKSLTWLNEELNRVLTPQSRHDTREYFTPGSNGT